MSLRPTLIRVALIGLSLAPAALRAAEAPKPAAPAAGAASAETASDAEKRKQAEIAAATAACETGAAIPLDPAGKAAAVPFEELLPADFNLAPLEALMAACAKASAAKPDDRRLELMMLRTVAAHYKTNVDPLVPAIRALAAGGSAEANFLVYRIHSGDDDPDVPNHNITRDEAVAALRLAVEAGHQSALEAALYEYRSGPLLRRDPKAAIAVARKLETLPPQGAVPAKSEAAARDTGARMVAYLLLTTDGLAEAEYAEGTARAQKIAAADPDSMNLPLAIAYRFGRGVAKDPERARKLLEGELAADRWYGVATLADMLANGEGGPADGKRALALLRDKRAAYGSGAKPALAGLLLDNRFVGPDPNAAARLFAASDVDGAVRAVPLLVDYETELDNPKALEERLAHAAAAGEPGAAVALARLRLSGNGQFRDPEKARAALIPLWKAGNADATWLLASIQYANLDSMDGEPFRLDNGGPTDDDIKALIEEGAKDKRPEAYLLYAKLVRRGVIYRQDDKAATNALISAANLGSAEGMVLLGDAYDDGLGTSKDPRERLHAWREAAKLGSLAAREKIARAFTFDSFDKLITLREGVSERVALHNNAARRRSGIPAGASASMDFAGLFMGGRADDAGIPALAEAVLDGYRLAPAGLDEAVLIPTLKAFPDEIRLEMETGLQREGFLKRPPDGYFSPDARDALRAYVEAKGPLPAPAATAVSAAPAADGGVDPAVLDRVRDKAFTMANKVKNKKQRTAVIRMLNVLARYGDPASRWALLRNYHQADFVRNNVTPAEITRYGMDILVGRPAGMDKPDFEFVFVVTQIQSDGAIGDFGSAALAAIRDDPRLQDPLALGGVLQALVFAPGACDALLDAGRSAKIGGLGEDGCDDATKAALIAYAKAAGPSGTDAKARAAAVKDIAALDKAKPGR